MENSKILEIDVKKNHKPILSPDGFEDYNSIRNPSAFNYNGNVGILSTVRYNSDGKSRIHLAWSDDKGKKFHLEEEPFINLNADSLLGVEDARINKIDNEYFITFTNYKETDGESYNITRIGLIRTKDFKDVLERKIILDKYGDNKNCVVFKTDNNSNFYVVHRPFLGILDERAFAKIEMTSDFENYKDLGKFLMPRENSWDDARVGINTPPIEISHPEYGDFLFSIYHGAKKEGNIYSMGYILMDMNDPERILERSEKPILTPTLDWEIGKGKYGAEVPNVVFGCGAVPMDEKTLRFYYAGADRYTGFADLTFKNAKIKGFE